MKRFAKISLLVWNLSTNDGIIRASLLGEALKRLGYQVEIVGFQFGKSFYAAATLQIPVTAVAIQENTTWLSAIKEILPKIDGDLVYAIKPQTASFGIGLLKKIWRRSPLILDIDDWELSWHGGDNWSYHPTPKQLARDIFKKGGALRRADHPLYLYWMEKLISQADLVTVHTNFLQKRFGGISVPNGKDIELFNPERYYPEESRRRYNLSSYRVLMFPGAPRPYKGLEDILVALELLNQPDLKLVIVGGSPYDNYDEQLVQQWGKWIVKLPSYPADAMPDIVAAADVVVVPQRDTPATRAQFPLKLTDGMAMAKPVLATRVGDIPEILGDTGYLIDPGSPPQIAEKIQWIFQNLEVANANGKRARARCVQHYSIEAMAAILQPAIAKLEG